MLDDLTSYRSESGRLVPVWTVAVQTIPDDIDRLLDAVVQVEPLRYGNYDRNAAVTAVGRETARPRSGSTTDTHVDEFSPGDTETYPMIEITFSIDRNCDRLDRVMTALLHAHHYEEPVIRVSEAWESRAAYDPNSSNPNRWWNDGRGLPERSTTWTD